MPSSGKGPQDEAHQRWAYAGQLLIGYHCRLQVISTVTCRYYHVKPYLLKQTSDGRWHEGIFEALHPDGSIAMCWVKPLQDAAAAAEERAAQQVKKPIPRASFAPDDVRQLLCRTVRMSHADVGPRTVDDVGTDAAIGRGKGGYVDDCVVMLVGHRSTYMSPPVRSAAGWSGGRPPPTRGQQWGLRTTTVLAGTNSKPTSACSMSPPHSKRYRGSYSIGAHDGHTRLAHTIGTHDWHTRLAHTIGTHDWRTRLAHTIGAPDWHTIHTRLAHSLHTRFTHAPHALPPPQELYSTKYDPKASSITPQEAARIAAEIERDARGSSNPHMREERGLVVDDSQVDEEDKYSAVVRQPPTDAQPKASWRCVHDLNHCILCILMTCDYCAPAMLFCCSRAWSCAQERGWWRPHRVQQAHCNRRPTGRNQPRSCGADWHRSSRQGLFALWHPQGACVVWWQLLFFYPFK